jgi:hypothetical protein
MSIAIPIHRAAILSATAVIQSHAASMLGAEAQGLALDFTDQFWLAATGHYGSAKVIDTGTPANNFDSIPDALLTYTGTTKLCRQSDGVYRYGPHNLYVNSAAPANQSITVVSGASYAVTITGSVSVTASGAATGTWTAGTNTFTAATATLTLGSTSGSGTVHVRRTPSDSTYLATGASAKYGLPFEWDTSGVLQGILVEPQATNLNPYSRPQAAWGIKVGYALTENSISGVLGGTTSVTLLTRTAGQAYAAGPSGIAKAAAAMQYTRSMIVKKSVGDYLTSTIQGAGGGERSNASFNLSTGAVISTQVVGTFTGASARVINLGDGWYLLTHTATTSTDLTVNAYLSIGSVLLASVDASDTGYPGTVASVYVEHDQLETGAVPTSPITTYGASAVRANDSQTLAYSRLPTMSGSGYSLFVHAVLRYGPNGGYQTFLALRNAAFSEVATLNVNPAGALKLYAVAAGIVSADISSGVTQSNGVPFKIAGSWAPNDFRISGNGSAVVSDTSGAKPSAFTLLEIAGSYVPFYVKSAVITPHPSTNTELQAITA